MWLGVSVESGEESCICGHSGRPVRDRVVELSMVPAVARFVSYEPAIGDPSGFLAVVDELRSGPGTAPDMIIYGGESGTGRRPEGTTEDPQAWAKEIRDFCHGADIAFWYKQESAFRPGQGVELNGEVIQELPIPRPGAPVVHPGQSSLFV